MDSPGDTFGATSVVIFLAMFGGSTFLLFLLCYCCQKKLREDTISVMEEGVTAQQQVYVIPAGNNAFHHVHGLPSPPPDYDSVVKKDPVFQFDENPPSYEVAVASLHTSRYT